MHVLFLTHRVPYAPNRGDRIRAFHILRALNRIAQVDLVSLVHDADEERRATDLATGGVRVWPARVSRSYSLLNVPHGLAGPRPMTHVLLDSPAMRRLLRQVVHRRRPDVVLAYCSGMARFALAPPLQGIPLVLDLVDVDSAKWDALAPTASIPTRWIYRREARCLRAFEGRACRAAATTLVVNERESRALAALAPDARIQVVENGVDVDGLAPTGPPSEGHTVVFCGVMNYSPNEEAVRWLVEHVWPRIRQQRPTARLQIVGSAPTRTVWRLATDAAGIEVTGPVPDVRPYLHSAAVAVAPLQAGRGVQNKVLEAVAAGLPCVVTPLVRDGLPPEILPACRTAGSPMKFADAILDLLGLSGAERRRVVARADLPPLSWERRLAPLRAILHHACGSAAS